MFFLLDALDAIRLEQSAQKKTVADDQAQHLAELCAATAAAFSPSFRSLTMRREID